MMMIFMVFVEVEISTCAKIRRFRHSALSRITDFITFFTVSRPRSGFCMPPAGQMRPCKRHCVAGYAGLPPSVSAENRNFAAPVAANHGRRHISLHKKTVL